MDKDLIIHYFLKDPTLHQLNARLVNTNQANIISIIEMLSSELGIEIDIDVIAKKLTHTSNNSNFRWFTFCF